MSSFHPISHAPRRDALMTTTPLRAPWLCLLVLSLTGLTAALCTTSARAAEPFSWTGPELVDQELPAAIACASSSLCVLTDDGGNVVTSTDPAGGASTWTSGHIDGVVIPSVSCPSSGLCVAIDATDKVLTSSDPAGGASTWQVSGAQLSGINLPSLSCPTTTFCAAVGERDVATSTEPTGGASAWHVSTLNTTAPYQALTSISCPSSSLCVATEVDGNVLTSTDPSEGASAWTSAYIDATLNSAHEQTALGDVSCPTTDFCVAQAGVGNIVASTDPTGGASAWHVVLSNPNLDLGRIACPSSGLCVGAGFVMNGGSCASSTLTEGGSSWTFAMDCAEPADISCPSTSFCAAMIYSQGDVFIGTGTESSGEQPKSGGEEPPSNQPSSGSTSGNSSVANNPESTSSAHVSTTQIALSLAHQLITVDKSLKVDALLKSGVSASFTALEAGTVTVQLYDVPKGATIAKKAKAKAVLVAGGSMTYSGNSTKKLTIHLTTAGRKLLKGKKKLKLETVATFTSSGKGAVRATKEVTLRGQGE